MTKRRVAITGLGLVSPFGGSTEDFFARIAAGESCIRHYRTEDQPRPLSLPAVRCVDFNPDQALGKPLAATMDRFAQLATAAAFEAWQQAGFSREDKSAKPDCGVSWGTALGGTLAYERGYRDLWQQGRERISPMSVVLGMNNAASAHIAIQLGLGNSCLSYTVACTSAAAAIGEAYRRIRDGEAERMLAGGSDAPLAYGVVRAWEALRVLAPGDEQTSPSACRPFHAGRGGLVLGEGAAALMLEEWNSAVARGAPILAELAGYGASCDHSHLVKPDATGQVRALHLALADAGLATDEVDYVNAHGTATKEGDPTEIEALRQVFGSTAERLPVSATKAGHGHLMGAAGAIEALITVLALHHDTLPPTAHLEQEHIDPACTGVRHILGSALRGIGARAALSNSFAFGGSNAVLAFRRPA
ncbi:MAG TPA: beta-ketoacyl-[acyl-carrier-protein] synthase family protein [Azospira sp.]|nr:beta-ketoacyl-[acyl-carrier-protein] synthase family protein [Azospira sp.]